MEISHGCTLHGFEQCFASRIAEASYGFLLRDKTNSNDTFRRFPEKREHLQAGIPKRVVVDMSEAGLTTPSGNGIRLAIFWSWEANMRRDSVAKYCEIVWPGPAIPVRRLVQLAITHSSDNRLCFDVFVDEQPQIQDRHVKIRYKF